MRFREICDHLLQFEAVQGACSREWQITPRLVMCTELDLSNFCGLPVSPTATQPPRDPSFLVVSFFRFDGPDSAVKVWADLNGAADPLWADERMLVDYYRSVIRSWVGGHLLSLPHSTSTRVAERLRPH